MDRVVLLVQCRPAVVTAAVRAGRLAPESLIPMAINGFRRLFDAAQRRPIHTLQR